MMATFFGDNDKSTLDDVVAYLRRRAEVTESNARHARGKEAREQQHIVANALRAEAQFIEECALNGPAHKLHETSQPETLEPIVCQSSTEIPCKRTDTQRVVLTIGGVPLMHIWVCPMHLVYP